MDISDLLIYAQKMGASDLHLSSTNPPIIRVDGDIVLHEIGPVSAEAVKDMLYSIMTESQRSAFESELELDFAISFGENVRFRVNAFNTIHGPAAVMRTIPTEVKTLGELGTPPIIERLAELHNGLILVTGPTGSGKSTTLSAFVDHINSNFPRHILTVEDPVEFIHQTKRSLINQREVGPNSKSFARALKSALREDPDVILVGELRDIETIQLALTAAETGHLVLATLHTKSAPEAVDRIIDVFPADSKEMVRAMLSNTMQAIITQRLLSRDEGGRVAAYEIMVGTPAVRNLVREGKIPQLHSMMQMGSRWGMITMKESIRKLQEEGKISASTAQNAVTTLIEVEREKAGGDDQSKAAPGRMAKTATNNQSDSF